MDKSFLAERDITTQNKGDGERLGAKQIGSKRAGEKYEKALEFFIRTRSSQIDGRANSKDIEREEFIKYCKENGLWKGKTVLDRCSKQFCFLKSDALVVQITK